MGTNVWILRMSWIVRVLSLLRHRNWVELLLGIGVVLSKKSVCLFIEARGGSEECPESSDQALNAYLKDLCSLEREDLSRKEDELVGLRIGLVVHSVPIM